MTAFLAATKLPRSLFPTVTSFRSLLEYKQHGAAEKARQRAEGDAVDKRAWN